MISRLIICLRLKFSSCRVIYTDVLGRALGRSWRSFHFGSSGWRSRVTNAMKPVSTVI